MTILTALARSFFATSAMTLFSYGYSALRNKSFKEPKLLNELLVRQRLLKHLHQTILQVG